jgi:predicted peptidase
MRRRLLLLVVLVAAGCAGTLVGDDAGPTGTAPASQRLVPLGQGSAPNGFHEYLPPGLDDGRARPLLVFWHGLGENGNGTTELSRVLVNGPPMLVTRGRWPEGRPFIVLSPQHAGGGCPGAAEVNAFVDWARSAYRVDARRIYLTGLSCGAIGVWSYLGTYTGSEVAAVVLIAGDPGDAWGKSGCALGQVAIWAFHGDADGTVGIAGERATMANLAACPAPPARESVWTEIPGGGHGIWPGIYDGTAAPDVYAWLLAHPKP